MNSFKTFTGRCSPQIVQRHFDVTVDGSPRRLHGVKGANGEWALALLTKTGWVEGWGFAWKTRTGWVIETGAFNVGATTMANAISAAIAIGDEAA